MIRNRIVRSLQFAAALNLFAMEFDRAHLDWRNSAYAQTSKYPYNKV